MHERQLEQTLAGLFLAGIGGDELVEHIHSLLVLAGMLQRHAFLVECRGHERRVRIGLEHLVHAVGLGQVVACQASHHRLLIHGIVGTALVLADGERVAFLGLGNLVGIIIGVANAVVGIAKQCFVVEFAIDSLLEGGTGIAVLLLLEQGVAQIIVGDSVVGVALRGGSHIALLLSGGLFVFALAVKRLGKPQATLVQDFLVVVAHIDGLLQIVGSRCIVAIGQRLATHIIEHTLLGTQHIFRRFLDVRDAVERLGIVAGVHVGIDEIGFDLRSILGIGILVEEFFKQVDRLAKGVGTALALGHSIVVESGLFRSRVVIHRGSLLKGPERHGVVAQLAFGLTQIEISALAHSILVTGDLGHIGGSALIVTGTEVHRTQRISGRAHDGVLRGLHIGVQILTRLLFVARVVVALTHQAVDFGNEVVVSIIFEQ